MVGTKLSPSDGPSDGCSDGPSDGSSDGPSEGKELDVGSKNGSITSMVGVDLINAGPVPKTKVVGATDGIPDLVLLELLPLFCCSDGS